MSTRTWRMVVGILLAVVVALLAPRIAGGGGGGSGSATESRPGPTSVRPTTRPETDPASGLPWIDAATLPTQAQDVLDDIDAGGPFDYPAKDGSTFRNFEGVLPSQPRGTYREYTVETPGSDDRGARRLVTSDGDRDGLDPDAVFWTDDHYDSFSAVRR